MKIIYAHYMIKLISFKWNILVKYLICITTKVME